MEMQSTLTLAIEIIFWAFVSLMIFDFTLGLYVVPLLRQSWVAQPQVVSSPTPSVLAPQSEPISNSWELEPQQITVIAPQFEQLPDPWKLGVETPSTKTQSVLLTLPTLRLLPPVKEVQQKSKRTKTSEKTKSITKATSTKTKQLPRRPRQKAS